MNFICRYIARLKNMSGGAYVFIKICIILCCVIAFSALQLMLYIEESGKATFYLLNIFSEMRAMPAAILLLAAIGSVCLEDISTQ